MAKNSKNRTEKLRDMRERPKTDPYKVLGVQRDASDEAIKRAYRRLAIEHHPDRNLGREREAEERFKEVAEAYNVLSDEWKRACFDEFGVNGPPSRRKKATHPPSTQASYRQGVEHVYTGTVDGVQHFHQVNHGQGDTLPGVAFFPGESVVVK